MLTIERINADLAQLRKEADFERSKPIKDRDDKKYLRLGRAADKLEFARLFVLNSPTSEFLEKEVERLERIVENIGNGFAVWKSSQQTGKGKTEKELKSEYDQVMEIAKHRRHLKNYRFIIFGE